MRPISSGIPKPMVPLLGKPLIQHITELLRDSGIREIRVTLGYEPEAIIDHLGDGSAFGVEISYHVEKVALGTAGGVRACRDFVGDDDFLVISGDAACDFDLAEFIDYHNRYRAAVSMALYSHSEPLQYGLVLTDTVGRVLGFIEKPSWERVITDCVNTGIYIVSSRAMELIPESVSFDFARDLFPMLLRRGEDIRAVRLDGYWCDVGNPESYYRCCMDALEGRLRLIPAADELFGSVWSASNLPQGVKFVPPCSIGTNVSIEPGTVIGPRAILGDGVRVKRGAVIRDSVLDNGSVIGAETVLSGCVICRSAEVPEGMRIGYGEVIASPESRFPPDSKQTPKSVARPRVPMRRQRELLVSGRAEIMRVLTESLTEFGTDFTDFSDGLKIATAAGLVRISPSPEREAIVVEATANEMEFSDELCAEYEGIVRNIAKEH